MTAKEIEKQLLRLAPRARAKLVKKLLHSLEELSDAENEQWWAQEALRRHEELAGGKTKGRPAEEVFRDAQASKEVTDLFKQRRIG